MVWNSPPSAGSTRSKTVPRRADELARPSRTGGAAWRGTGSTARSHGRSASSPSRRRRCSSIRSTAGVTVPLDRVVEALAVGRGVVEAELGREDVVAEVGEPGVARRLLAQREHRGRTAPPARRAARCRAAWPARKARSRTCPIGALEERLQLGQRPLLALPTRPSSTPVIRWYRALSSSSSAKMRHVGLAEDLDRRAEPGERRGQLGRGVARAPRDRRASSTLRSSIFGRISVEKRRWSASFSGSDVSMV